MSFRYDGGMTALTHPIERGDQFERLTVLDASNRLAVRCRCTCGTEKNINAAALYSGRTRSCGCLHREVAQIRGRANAGAPVATGDRFGRLTVLDPAVRRRVKCLCDCGREHTATADRLVSGHTQSCGCLRSAPRTHGMTNHELYPTWQGMWARCTKPEATGYRNYGGRGISVHEPWRDPRRFITELEAEIGPRPDGKTLDRIDKASDYVPGNLRWATWEEQASNRRSTWRDKVTCPSCGHHFPVGESA